ncbi:two-component system, sensor histidine kinase YesM [Gracilibacillus ureilyticus]|uniref:histidine kinase n=1 Tax=Gracilibacillus ureilyticus TaxID=531814 RepID=A0A1H9PU90_9BACI|nr:sensor histidine kinase [Gracilibacillus ureilyticus]SER51173.1 two-component system, sensor histidine kinase YesM [Gracilibacillus ureilyticus]
MKKLPLKVSQKLLGIYLIVTAIPILLVGAYLNYSTREIVISNVLKEVETNADKMEMRLNTIFNRVTNTSDLLYINDNLKTLLANEYETLLDVYNAYNQYPVFDEFIKYYDEIENIQFFMNKNMITNSYFIHADNSVRSENWYKEAVSNRGKINWVYIKEHWTEKEYLTLTRSIFGNANELLGVLAIYISPDVLATVVEGEPYNTFITLDKEVIVYHKDPTFLGESPVFFADIKQDNRNYLIDTKYQSEDVKLSVHEIVPEKSLTNSVQISTIIPVEEIMEEPNIIFTRGFLITSGALLVSVILIGIFIRSFYRRIEQLRKTMFQVAKGNFQITKKMKGSDEISQVYEDLATTTKSVQKIIDEVYIHKIKEETWKRKQKEIDFKMLASQINPHFLYNTLETIRMKALVNKDPEVAKLIKMLSKMMRSALERTDKPVPIKEELELIEHYLEIQHVRFGNKFTYDINVEEGILSNKIFPLLIQPIVENAVIHGLESKEEAGFIHISIMDEDRYMRIEVKDNGIGIPKKQLYQIRAQMDDENYQSDGNRIGLHNVQQRIKLYYGDAFGIEIESIFGLGTTMAIKLPKRVE